MEKQKRILAIHDLCCVGKCSLTVALPVLSAAGMEACALPTALFSAHTAFPSFTFRDLTEELPPIAAELKKQQLGFDAIYTGYLGTKEQTTVVGKVIDTLKQSDTLLLVDPAMADNGSLYRNLPSDFPKGMLALTQKATVITPNVTEAALLLGLSYTPPPHKEAYIRDLLYGLRDVTGASVVITSISFADGEIGCGVLSIHATTPSYIMRGRRQHCYHGTGDVFASVLCAALMHGLPLETGVAVAEDFVTDALLHTGTEPEVWYGIRFEDLLPSLPDRLSEYTPS